MAIYFIQCGTNGPIKIGQTSNPVIDRMAQLQTSCPYGLKILWIYNGYGFSEADIHKEFKHERIRGEWFRPSVKIFEFINEELSNHEEIYMDNAPLIVQATEYLDGEVLIHTRYGDISINKNRFVVFPYKKTSVHVDK